MDPTERAAADRIMQVVEDAELLTPAQLKTARHSLSVSAASDEVRTRFGFLGETNVHPWDGEQAAFESIINMQAAEYVTTLKLEKEDFGTIE